MDWALRWIIFSIINNNKIEQTEGAVTSVTAAVDSSHDHLIIMLAARYDNDHNWEDTSYRICDSRKSQNCFTTSLHRSFICVIGGGGGDVLQA